MSVKVSVIIVNFNKYEDTIACVESIKNSDTIVSYNIILVDNCSSNNSFEQLQKITDNKIIYLLKSAKNNGYCAGNNIGIKFALENFNSEYIWILNPDTLVDKDAMQNLYNFAQTKNDLGILGCRLVYYPDTQFLQGLGGGNFKIQKSGLLAPGIHLYHLYPSDTELPAVVNPDLVIGASMFVPKKVFETCGLMNERFYLYSDENEFCLRVAKFGFKHYAISNATVYHKEGWRQNVQKLIAVYYTKRNSLIMTKELFPEHLFRNLFFSYCSQSILSYIWHRNWKALALYFKGINDFKKGIDGKVDLSKWLGDKK